MRTFKLIALAALVTVFASCKNNDDDGGTPDVDLILGLWTGTGVDYSGTTVTEASGQTITADFTGESFDENYTLNISSDPNEFTSEGTYSLELTTTVLGQSSTETVTGLTLFDSGTWELNGSELTITSGGETSTGTIVELTENTLRISATEEETVTDPDLGFTITTTVTAIATYTK